MNLVSHQHFGLDAQFAPLCLLCLPNRWKGPVRSPLIHLLGNASSLQTEVDDSHPSHTTLMKRATHPCACSSNLEATTVKSIFQCKFRPQALLTALLLLLALGRQSSGQATTGQILGQVTDPTGAVVRGATISATDEQKGVTFNGVSDGAGNYIVLSVPPGLYSVTASATGFAEAKFTHAELVIDQHMELNFHLKVGTAAASIEINEAPPALQTQSAEVGTTISGDTIVDLPLLGRNFYGLTTLVPGVATYGQTNALNLSVSGQREFSNSVQLDGIESTTNRTQDITITPNVDSVEEFKVITASYNAEFGNAAGGVLEVQTKAGTNHIHGDAFEFFRPNFLTSKSPIPGDPAPQPNSILKQHNFGGTVGGPIKKDRAFLFAAYEGLRNTNAFTELDSTIPFGLVNVTPSGSVDLSGLVDPNAGQPGGPPAGTTDPIFDPNYTIENCSNGTCPAAQQFPGNVIPASRVSQAGLNTLLDFFPKPNLPGTNNGWFKNYQVFSPVTDQNNKVDSRFDIVLSNKDRLYSVYHWYDDNDLVTDPYHGHTVVPGAGDADQANHELDGAQSLSLTYDHIFSPTALNEFRFGYLNYHQQQESLLDGTDYSTKYGWGNVAVPGFPATDAYPYIDLADGYLAGGSTYKPFRILDQNYQFTDAFTWSGLKGHELKFGGDLRLLNSHPDFTIFPTGFTFFDSFGFALTSDPRFYYGTTPFISDVPGGYNYDGGSDIADLLLGLPEEAAFGLQLSRPHTQSWNLDFYAQDSYRVTPRLTLNYGLRYEFQDPWTESSNDQSNYDVATGNLLLAGLGGNSRSLINPRRDEFSPRFGFALQVHPTTVLRFGGAIFYSPENDGREDLLTSNIPFADKSNYVNSYANGPQTSSPSSPYLYQADLGITRNTAIPFPANGAGILNPSTLADAASFTVDAVNPNMKTGTTGSFNLSLQQQLTKTVSMDVAWVGSISKHLSYKVGDINANPATGGDGLINPNLAQIQYLTDAGLSNFNSLQAKLTKQASRNISFLVSYTWGHSLDNGPAPFDVGLNNDNPQNPNNLKPEYATSDADVRQNVVVSGSYNLPFGRGQLFGAHWGPVLNSILGGWRYSPIANLRTGTPVNVIDGADPTGSFPGVRPNLVGNPVLPRNKRTIDEWFNTAAFSHVTQTPGSAVTIGTAGRNLVTGPGFIGLDSSLAKDIKFEKRFTFQMRLEAFNTFNSEHYSNPDGDLNDGTFGQITEDIGSSNRVAQIAGKIIF
jgi:Carboxypeptidase regulatory-like domain